VYRTFQDGERHKNHYLFSDPSKKTLEIQLYYDGLGITNPFKGVAGIQAAKCSTFRF
jgi:hypothetical protein